MHDYIMVHKIFNFSTVSLNNLGSKFKEIVTSKTNLKYIIISIRKIFENVINEEIPFSMHHFNYDMGLNNVSYNHAFILYIIQFFSIYLLNLKK